MVQVLTTCKRTYAPLTTALTHSPERRSHVGRGLAGWCLMDVRVREAEPSPAMTPELLLLRVFVSAYLHTVPRKKAEAFLREASALLATEEAVATLLPMRGPHDLARSTLARREAVAMYRSLLPVLVAAIER